MGGSRVTVQPPNRGKSKPRQSCTLYRPELGPDTLSNPLLCGGPGELIPFDAMYASTQTPFYYIVILRPFLYRTAKQKSYRAFVCELKNESINHTEVFLINIG